jgi:hypothetical protein
MDSKHIQILKKLKSELNLLMEMTTDDSTKTAAEEIAAILTREIRLREGKKNGEDPQCN